MFDLNVRWQHPLDGRVSCPPVQIRDLTVVRQSNVITAIDEDGRQVWQREIAAGPEEGELAANDEFIVSTYTIEITDGDGERVCAETRFDLWDEGAECVGTLTAHGTMRSGGLVMHTDAMHAWMNDSGVALRRMRFDQEHELAEVFVPFAQPWDGNVSKRGVVLIGFNGRREGACLWNPRTQAMNALLEDVDVWSHGLTDEVAVFAVGPNEVETTLIAVDLKTREEIWRREDTTRGIAVCDVGVLVYLGGQDRVPALLDIDTGDVLWSASTAHRGFSWEVVGSIAMSRGRKTVAFDVHTGRSLGAAVLGGVLKFEDHFVAVVDDHLVAFEYPTARPEQEQPPIIIGRGARRTRMQTPVLADHYAVEARLG